MAKANGAKLVAGDSIALAAGGTALAKPLLVNKCRVAIPAGLIDSPWLRQAWDGIDPAQVEAALYHDSGLKALSGIGSDLRGECNQFNP